MRKILYITFLFLGLSFFLAVFLSVRATKDFIRTAQTITARVSAVELEADGLFTPKITFSVGSGEIITVDSPERRNPSPFEQGEEVLLYYNTDYEPSVVIRSFYNLYGHTLRSVFFGLLFTWAGSIRFFSFSLYRKQLRALRKENVSLQGKVSYLDKKKLWCGYAYFWVDITYRNGNKRYRSPLLWRPARFVESGQELTVYIDQKHPKRYSIDIPHLSDMV